MQSLCKTLDNNTFSPCEDVPRYSTRSSISRHVPYISRKNPVPLIASRSKRLQVQAEHTPTPVSPISLHPSVTVAAGHPISPISLHPSATAAAGRPNPHHLPTKYAGPSRSYLSPGGVPAAQFNDALSKELAGNTFNANSDFLEQLLPRERLPFPVDEGLLRKLSTPMGTNPPIWNELKNCFRQPPIDFGEAAVCKWLNNIGTTMGLIYGRQCDRLWWSGRCRMPLVSSSVHRAPDLILLDRIYYNRSTETEIHA